MSLLGSGMYECCGLVCISILGSGMYQSVVVWYISVCWGLWDLVCNNVSFWRL